MKVSRLDLLVSTILGCTAPALAQEVPRGTSGEPVQPATNQVTSLPETAPAAGGDIVVTAMRRETTVQNTAATIAVLSADQLAKAGVTGSMSLQFQTPGLVISQDLGLQTQVYIRGVGSNLQGIAVSNSVATYIDGVYLPNTIQAAQTFNNIERIEVLKGPQATLYGRNATGGAINIVTQRPSFTFSGKADASYGNYNAYQFHVSATAPLAGDKLAGAIAAQYEHHDGYAHNLFNGKDLLFDTAYGVRGSLLFKATPDLTFLLRGDYTHDHTADFHKLLPATAAYYTGASQWFTPDPRAAYNDIQNDEPGHDAGVSLTIENNNPLGKLTSVTSYRTFKVGPIFNDSDQVATPSSFFPAGIGRLGDIVKSGSFYHETYLATDPREFLSVIVGGTFFNEHAQEFKRQLTGSAASPLLNTDRYAVDKAAAGYIDGTVHLTRRINLVAGVRYTDEDRSYHYYRVLPAGAATFSSGHYKNWSPRFGIEVRPADHVLLFATATSGFKSGGFNTDTPTNGFNPEKIWSYEGGVKTTLFDSLRLNASGFYYKYTDIQVLQYLLVNNVLTPIITNAGSAKLWGADVTADYRATRDLTFGASLSLLHTEFGSSIFCDPLVGSCTATNPAMRPNVDVKGNRLPRAPRTTANLYADYTIPMPDDARLNLHGEGAYRSKAYYTVFQNDIFSSPSFWLVNANLRYTARAGWFVEAYVQNIANKLAITNMIASNPIRTAATGALLGGTPAQFLRYSPPRTFGGRIGVKF